MTTGWVQAGGWVKLKRAMAELFAGECIGGKVPTRCHPERRKRRDKRGILRAAKDAAPRMTVGEVL
jgi:hypothetical protein